MTEIATAVGGGGKGSERALSAAVHAYLVVARAPATRRANASDWAHLDIWCTTHTDETGRVVSAPPASAAVVATYLPELAATLTRRCSAISPDHPN